MTKKVLAIDTSCDDTSAAVVEGVTVRSNIIASQTQLHKKYGGVFPTVAKQAHTENIEATVSEALSRGQTDWNEIDAVAVTQGPGLAPSLEIGIKYAQQLATDHHLPLIPINHIEGHLWSPLAEGWPHSKHITKFEERLSDITFPVLGIVVSGGHTEFVLVTAPGEYHRLGHTIDDAAGEALDKIGRMLDLGYPAGPVIEEFALKGNPQAFKFPLPMTSSGDFNLSFSGLKTFARNTLAELEAENKLHAQTTYDFAASSQYAVFRHICHKLSKLLPNHPTISQVWLGGGVAVNNELKKMLRATLREYNSQLKLHSPYTPKLCMDNAAMIGLVAQFHEPSDQPLDRIPRWKIDA